MRGEVVQRRTAHCGYSCEFGNRRTQEGAPIPDFRLPVRPRRRAYDRRLGRLRRKRSASAHAITSGDRKSAAYIATDALPGPVSIMAI